MSALPVPPPIVRRLKNLVELMLVQSLYSIALCSMNVTANSSFWVIVAVFILLFYMLADKGKGIVIMDQNRNVKKCM